MRFSKSTQCFYPEDIDYPILPADVVEVPRADFDRAMSRASGETLDLVNGVIVLVPAPPPSASQLQACKYVVLDQARSIRDQILNRLNGILLSYIVKGDNSHNVAIETARQGLLDMTADPGVVAATDGPTTKAAVMACYGRIVTALTSADPTSVSAFNEMSL